MLLKRLTHCHRPLELQTASAGLLGQRASFRLDRSQPIEEMVLVVDVTLGGTAPVLSAITTPQVLDNIMGIVKRFQLNVTDLTAPRPVIDSSGMGLLEWASKAGMNLDRGTLHALGLSSVAAGSSIGSNSLKVRIAYRIPIVNPMASEPLRTRMLLPVHTFAQDPVVNIDFAAATDFATSAASISAVVAHLYIVRRIMPDSITQAIQASGGFIRSDLIETLYTVAPGVSGEQRFPIPLTGQYAGLCYRHYLGGAAVTRALLDQTTTFGAETVWRIMMGQTTTLHEFRFKDLSIYGDYDRTKNTIQVANAYVAGSLNGSSATLTHIDPDFAGAAASGTCFPADASCMIDFLGDGIETADELGGLLDAETPIRAGMDLSLVGNVASVATVGSSLYLVAQRYFDNLAAYQTFKL
jgi:hypothetical protein